MRLATPAAMTTLDLLAATAKHVQSRRNTDPDNEAAPGWSRRAGRGESAAVGSGGRRASEASSSSTSACRNCPNTLSGAMGRPSMRASKPRN